MFKQSFGLLALVLFIAGCSDQGGDSVAKKTGDAVGEVVTDFASGLGSGVDKGLDVSVEISEKAAAQGMSTTVAKKLGIDRKGITVYVLTQQPVKGQLLAKAMNAENREIGRAVVEVDFSADDAKYVVFNFDDEIDMLRVEKYILDIKAPATVEQTIAPEDAKVVSEDDKAE